MPSPLARSLRPAQGPPACGRQAVSAWRALPDKRHRRRRGRQSAPGAGTDGGASGDGSDSGGAPAVEQPAAALLSSDEAYSEAVRQRGFRLFSRLNDELRHEPGTVFQAAALICGTTVGAGILALPAVTERAGFVASSAAITAFCGYSIVTGLLVAEANINTLCELGAGRGVSLSSMARRTLGGGGAAAVSAAYLLIHWALLVAYIAKAGETAERVAGVPAPVGAAAFVAGVGGLCYLAKPAQLGAVNTALVAVFVASFLGLVGVAAADLQPAQLAVARWAAVPDALPVVALAYVFQNVVPVVAADLEGDVGKIRQAVVAGVAVPWLMFEAWEAAVLGSSRVGGDLAAAGGTAGAAAAAAVDPLALLRDAGGPLVTPLVDGFTALAVATSAIGFVLGLSEFFGDALQLPTGSRRLLPYALTVGPPLACAVAFPDVFFSALDIAGTYGVLTLFGIMPAAMVWSERYGGTTLSRVQIVPGGRAGLVAVAAVAAGIIGRELLLAAGLL